MRLDGDPMGPLCAAASLAFDRLSAAIREPGRAVKILPLASELEACVRAIHSIAITRATREMTDARRATRPEGAAASASPAGGGQTTAAAGDLSSHPAGSMPDPRTAEMFEVPERC